MKETKTTEFKNSVIKHLREQNYNINQPKKDENLYAIFPKKLLKFINDCNNQSQKMKFILKEDGILMLDTVLANIYQKEEFQRFLDDINYDTNELLKGSNLIIEMPM